MVHTLRYMGLVPGIHPSGGGRCSGTYLEVYEFGARYSPFWRRGCSGTYLEVYESGAWVVVHTLRYMSLVPGINPSEGGRCSGGGQQGDQLWVAGSQGLDGVDQIGHRH